MKTSAKPLGRYVDGFVIPVPKKNLKLYQSLASRAGKIWKEYGALEYRECVGDDLGVKGITSFPLGIRIKKNETVIFSWIVYKSRAHRDSVNKKIMKDPRIQKMMIGEQPFESKRMMYGGFRIIVNF